MLSSESQFRFSITLHNSGGNQDSAVTRRLRKISRAKRQGAMLREKWVTTFKERSTRWVNPELLSSYRIVKLAGWGQGRCMVWGKYLFYGTRCRSKIPVWRVEVTGVFALTSLCVMYSRQANTRRMLPAFLTSLPSLQLPKNPCTDYSCHCHSFFLLHDIIGFRRSWTEFFRLLGYYAAWCSFKPTFRDYISVPSSRVRLSKKNIA